MPALYTVSDHGLLNGKVRAWGSEIFEANQLLAETLLGLGDAIYTFSPDVERIELAVVLQMNFQAEQGVDPFVLEEVWLLPQKQRRVFRDRMVDPRALALVQAVEARNATLGDRWGGMVSYRRE